MKPRRISPAQFFALRLAKGSMSDAHCATHISYATVHDAKSGRPVSVATAQRLEAWSRGVEEAQALGVSIDPVVAVGLATAPKLPQSLVNRIAKQPQRAARAAA